MPKRTLRIDVQEDSQFIAAIETDIKRKWNALTPPERAIVSILIKALNDDRQARTPELCAGIEKLNANVSLEKVIHNLRIKHLIPIIATVGCTGGYRLPVSKSDCNLFLQAEINVLFKKIERLLEANKAMLAHGVNGASSQSGLEALGTLYRVHQLKATEDEPLPIKARRR